MTLASLLLERSKSLRIDLTQKGRLITFLNPYSYLIGRSSLGLYTIFDNIGIDGILLVVLLKCLGIRRERVSFDGTSLAPVIFRQCASHSMKIALIGGEDGVAKKAAEAVEFEYHCEGLVKIIENGFLTQDQRLQTQARIRDEHIDVVIVGMGAKLQEQFLSDLRASGWNGWGITCGGYLKQTAKMGTQYYPAWVDKFNIRWIYRIYDEPVLLRRYAFDYPYALILFVLDFIKSPRK